MTWIFGISFNKNNVHNIHIQQNGSVYLINISRYILTKQMNHKTAPFLFTNCMKSPLDTHLYSQFVNCLVNAYCILRNRYTLLSNLLLLMISSQQIPQILNKFNILYLKKEFKLDTKYHLNKQQIAIHIKKTLKACLDNKTNKQIL